jgi:hypothetical protein
VFGTYFDAFYQASGKGSAILKQTNGCPIENMNQTVSDDSQLACMATAVILRLRGACIDE